MLQNDEHFLCISKQTYSLFTSMGFSCKEMILMSLLEKYASKGTQKSCLHYMWMTSSSLQELQKMVRKLEKEFHIPDVIIWEEPAVIDTMEGHL